MHSLSLVVSFVTTCPPLLSLAIHLPNTFHTDLPFSSTTINFLYYVWGTNIIIDKIKAFNILLCLFLFILLLNTRYYIRNLKPASILFSKRWPNFIASMTLKVRPLTYAKWRTCMKTWLLVFRLLNILYLSFTNKMEIQWKQAKLIGDNKMTILKVGMVYIITIFFVAVHTHVTEKIFK